MLPKINKIAPDYCMVCYNRVLQATVWLEISINPHSGT